MKRIPTAEQVREQGPVELRFDVPLDPGDKTLPLPRGVGSKGKPVSKAEMEQAAINYQRTLAAGGLIDRGSKIHTPARVSFVDLKSWYPTYQKARDNLEPPTADITSL